MLLSNTRRELQDGEQRRQQQVLLRVTGYYHLSLESEKLFHINRQLV